MSCDNRPRAARYSEVATANQSAAPIASAAHSLVARGFTASLVRWALLVRLAVEPDRRHLGGDAGGDAERHPRPERDVAVVGHAELADVQR